MRSSLLLIVSVVLLLFSPLAGCGPFLVIPGGELEGEVTRLPEDWSISDEISTIQVETRPEDPYSVNLWAVGMGPALYVHAGANRSTWAEHMEVDPRIRVRLEGQIFELRAVRVVDEDEFARVADAWEEKYNTRFRNENVDEAYLFRMEGR